MVIKGTNVDPALNGGKNASSIKVYTQLYVKIGDKDITVKSKEPISMSRNKALRNTAAYYLNNGNTANYTAEEALDSKKTNIADIKNDVYRWLGISSKEELI